ncbi:GNAT family N-acetyltransferase [Kibdelosporangium aridum]|nr:GNAT family N-acetyltransferase [Kibdelosporangium aridum]
MNIAPVSVAEAMPLLREYWAEIAGRYHGRPMTTAEVDEIVRVEPSDDLLMLVATVDAQPVGCLGLNLSIPPFAEVKRMYVTPAARGHAVGQALLAEAERAALRHDAVTMRLNVRDDLVEARGLYAKCGYLEVDPFNDDDFVAHWLAKDLLYTTPVGRGDPRLAGMLAALDRDLRDRYPDEDIGPSPVPPGARFVLACRGQSPVGCVSVQPKGNDFELKRMFVAPQARGTGVALLLLEAAASVVLDAGGRRIVLQTGTRQPEAIRLYEKSGYTRIPNHQDPLSVCFAKDLTGS